MNRTPGEWKVLREGRQLYVVDEQEVTVAAVTLQPLEPEWQEGNARLIAAAPEMYEALKAMASIMPQGYHEPRIDAARAAIAKAEGR